MRLGLDAGSVTMTSARDLGIRGVPISADALVAQGPEAVLAPLRALGLQPCQIGAFGYNPLSQDAGQLERQTFLLEQAIPLAAATGCPYLVINGGNYHPAAFGAYDPRNYTDAALDLVAASLEPLIRLAEKHGVAISIEAYLKTAVYSADRFLQLWRRLPSPALRCNLDVTSLYDYWDMLQRGIQFFGAEDVQPVDIRHADVE